MYFVWKGRQLAPWMVHSIIQRIRSAPSLLSSDSSLNDALVSDDDTNDNQNFELSASGKHMLHPLPPPDQLDIDTTNTDYHEL